MQLQFYKKENIRRVINEKRAHVMENEANDNCKTLPESRKI